MQCLGDKPQRCRWTLDDWRCEDESIVCNIDADIEELVDCVELPAELCAHREAASMDVSFEATCTSWYGYVHDNGLMLALEQSCDDQGLLLAAEMRALRLNFMPASLEHKLGVFMQRCPRHVRTLIVHEVFWQVRFERIRRISSPVLAR